MYTVTTRKGKEITVYTRTDINQMPTIDPDGNLEFQWRIYAMLNGMRAKVTANQEG